MSEAPVPPADHAAPVELRRSWWRPLVRWESALVLLLITTLLYGVSVSPAFWRSDTLFYVGLNVGEVAIMALPVALIVITGEIDLSIASILGLTGVVMAELFKHGWSIWLGDGRGTRRRNPVRRVQRLPRHRPRPALARRHDRDADTLPRDRAGDPPDRHDRRLPERACEHRRRPDPRHAGAVVDPLLRRARGRRSGSCSTRRRSGARSSRSARRRKPRSSPASA